MSEVPPTSGVSPQGWDAFGLPAEQYAIDTGTHPSVTTRKNIDRFRSQLKARQKCVTTNLLMDISVTGLLLRLGAGGCNV